MPDGFTLSCRRVALEECNTSTCNQLVCVTLGSCFVSPCHESGQWLLHQCFSFSAHKCRSWMPRGRASFVTTRAAHVAWRPDVHRSLLSICRDRIVGPQWSTRVTATCASVLTKTSSVQKLLCAHSLVERSTPLCNARQCISSAAAIWASIAQRGLICSRRVRRSRPC